MSLVRTNVRDRPSTQHRFLYRGNDTDCCCQRDIVSTSNLHPRHLIVWLGSTRCADTTVCATSRRVFTGLCFCISALFYTLHSKMYSSTLYFPTGLATCYSCKVRVVMLLRVVMISRTEVLDWEIWLRRRLSAERVFVKWATKHVNLLTESLFPALPGLAL